VSTATARANPRPATLPRTSLTVVPRRQPKAGRGVFGLLLLVLLVGGLMTLLALNTALAQDSFVVKNLQDKQATLDDQEQQLMQQVAILESPETLAAKARALGMIRGGKPTFLTVGGTTKPTDGPKP
jgi:cell division protein FtsB